jgi:anti-sigma factor RsiW
MNIVKFPHLHACERVGRLLGQYIDGACPPTDVQRVRQHVSRCPGCARELAALEELQRHLRRLAADSRTPDGLWVRMSDRLDRAAAMPPLAATDRPQSPTRRWVMWAASAAALGTVAVGAQRLLPLSSVEPVIAEPVQDFITFRLSGRTEDFVSRDAAELARWAESRTTFALPPLRQDLGDYQLTGGRLCWLLDRRLAGISYARGSEKAVVYLMDGAGLSIPTSGRPLDTGARVRIHHYKGHGVAVWREHDIIYVVVARNETLKGLLPALSSLAHTSRHPEPRAPPLPAPG